MHGQTITIRQASPLDGPALRRLAELDSGRAPPGEALLAYVDGELWAAVDVADGHAVADPFHPTEDVLRLVRLRATQQRGDPRMAA
jgi:hypothetical protein